ncbi:MAG TPA: cytidylate kinase-like family protein [Capsulimonadaceae bacterium]|jgi:cytidylate kinase
MELMKPIVITISRLRGCGGAYIGQRIAADLGLVYMDRQIVDEAAKKLDVPIEVIESRDERMTSVWKSIVEAMALANVYAYVPPPLYLQDDKSVHDQESAAIQHIAATQSAVIVGRAGSFILREHPRHVRVFLHASVESRKRRLQQLYEITAAAAEATIAQTDRERAQYIRAVTGREISDATQYDLCIDTGALGLEETEKMIVEYVRTRFGWTRTESARN